MAAHQIRHRVPFPFITGLPDDARREIERDFAYLGEALDSSGAVTPYDAVIDPSMAASDPTNHRYINLTDLVANETWDPDYNFKVAVISHTAHTASS